MNQTNLNRHRTTRRLLEAWSELEADRRSDMLETACDCEECRELVDRLQRAERRLERAAIAYRSLGSSATPAPAVLRAASTAAAGAGAPGAWLRPALAAAAVVLAIALGALWVTRTEPGSMSDAGADARPPALASSIPALPQLPGNMSMRLKPPTRPPIRVVLPSSPPRPRPLVTP